MADDSTELTNSRVLLQQQAMARVQEAVRAINAELVNAARLGLRADITVHLKRRDTHRTPDGELNDISVAPGDAETQSIEVLFGVPRPPASVIAMRGF